MKKILLGMAMLALSLPTMAQKSKKKNGKTAEKAVAAAALEDSQEERQKKAANIESRMMGPMHHMLVQWSGHWREEVKIFTGDKNETTSTRWERDGNMMMGGKFLNMHVMGIMANEAYEANATIGYDNVKRKFVKTWYDNFGSSILVLEGDYDEKTKSITYEGSTLDPLTRVPVKIRQVQKNPDPTTQTLEVFTLDKEGKEIKTMEINSARG